MKKLSTLFLSMLMATGISISAQGTADFETLNSGKVGSSYGSYSTTAGWSVTNSQANKNALWNADELTPILNGGNPTGGTITSPTLTGGIGKLTFKYGYPFKDEKGYKARIDIKKDGEVVKTETLTNASTSYGTAYSYTSADFNLVGDFEIVITNLCPQQAAKKDRLAIWDLSWTGYTGGGDDPDPEPAEKWYLVGALTSWEFDESLELTAVEGEENAYSITLPSLQGEWKIWTGAWADDGGKAFGPGNEVYAASGVAIDAWCNGLGSKNFNYPIKPETEVTITLTIPEGADVSGASEPAKVVVDYTAKEDDPEPSTDKWYIVGDNTGWGLDESKELKLADGEESVYTISLPEGLSGSWKIWNGSWDKSFGAAGEDKVYAASDEELPVYCGSSINLNYPIKENTPVTISIAIPEGADVKDSATPATLVVNYTAKEDDPSDFIPATLGILSTPWNDGIKVTAMEYDADTQTFHTSNYKVGENANNIGYVQFGTNTEATSWAELSSGTRYAAGDDQTLVFEGDTAIAPVKVGSDRAFEIPVGEYDFSLKFDADNKTITLTAKVTPTGVENVSIDADNEADAEYFNLQGVKVAEPSNGIFIRRANGKSTKVFVK